MVLSDAVQIELIHAITTVASSLIIAIPAVIGAYVSWKVLRQGAALHQIGTDLQTQGERNHQQMNGRMEEMLKLKGEVGQALGVQQERDRPK